MSSEDGDAIPRTTGKQDGGLMAVYVDDMEAPFTPTHVQNRTYVMCHMIADTHDELVEMADRIGVHRKWIQQAGNHGEHFDIAKSKRDLAIRCGAIPIGMRELAEKTFARRTDPQGKTKYFSAPIPTRLFE
jgi:hypothetical protein